VGVLETCGVMEFTDLRKKRRSCGMPSTSAQVTASRAKGVFWPRSHKNTLIY
jgi:hypothetical protein